MKARNESGGEARATILGRVRRNLAAVTTADAAARRIAAEAAMNAALPGPQPGRADDPTARFLKKVEAMSSTTDRVAGLAEAPQAVARYLAANGLPLQIAVSPELAALDWAGAGLAAAVRGAVDADTVGVTGCFCAIAETGTLMLASSPDTPPTLSLLPETHVALVGAENIVDSFDKAFARLRRAFGTMPPAVNLVSGPSRTADIEQTIVLGAHGPCRVHVVLAG